MKTAKGATDNLNRYGIADAARIRITAHILHTAIVPTLAIWKIHGVKERRKRESKPER